MELKPGGRDIPVTNSNRISYIHLVADYRLNKQVSTSVSFPVYSPAPKPSLVKMMLMISIIDLSTLECFQMTSRQPYDEATAILVSQTNFDRLLNSFLFEGLSFVSINLLLSRQPCDEATAMLVSQTNFVDCWTIFFWKHFRLFQ